MSKQAPQAVSNHIIELNPGIKVAQGDDDSAHRYIAVSGTIGAGKSTLVDFVHQHYGIQPYFEPNEANPYLADFYEDMARWAFQSQIYFLTAKFALHLEIDASPSSVIQDRTIWEDAEIFATNLRQQGYIQDRDWATYHTLYTTVSEQLRPPDLMIYLRCPVRTVRKRIALRGRPMERDIPVAYLRQLHHLYENWIASYTLSPLVIIDTSQIDYLTDLVDQHDVMVTLDKYLATR